VSDDRDREAEKEIETFARRLLALTSGRAIPRRWKQKLARALIPLPKKPGIKLNPQRYAAIVADLALLSEKERSVHTKHNNPAKHFDTIARRHGVSRRTVKRIESECRSIEDLEKISPEKRKARVDGLRAAIDNSWSTNCLLCGRVRGHNRR
jgi:hypothetical protein